MTARTALIGALLLGLSAGEADAAGGTGEYRLPWKTRGETLAYHACGCADSCWVATVRDSASGRTKARLRCDCEKLHAVYPWPGREKTIAETCSPVDGEADKPAAIAKTLRGLMDRYPERTTFPPP